MAAPPQPVESPKPPATPQSILCDEAMARVESKRGQMQLNTRFHRRKIEEDYEMTKKVLGSGVSGDVRMAKSRLNKGQTVAVKAFKLAGMKVDTRKQLASEVEVSLTLDHPHVTRLFGVYETPEHLHFVMECMEGGELFDRVEKITHFSERDAAEAVSMMLLAVNYIHNHKIVHADLKLENFLYDKKGSNHLKLIDFGFSKFTQPDEKMRAFVGTYSYAAPEVFAKSYAAQCDLWSLGVIAFILLVGYMPFAGCKVEQKKKIIAGDYKLKPEKWNRVSKDALEFVKGLLQVDAKKRFTAQCALDHRWIANREKCQREEVTSDIAHALQQFGRVSQFRRCCMQSMAWSLSNCERAQVRQHFMSIDTSQQGTITCAELTEVMEKKLDLSHEEAEEIFNVLDSNQDKLIHYSDFLAAMVDTHIKLHDDLLRVAFKKFDVDDSGYITVDNMRDVLGETTCDDEIYALIKEADAHEDHRISFPEFVAYMKGTSLEEQSGLECVKSPAGVSSSAVNVVIANKAARAPAEKTDRKHLNANQTEESSGKRCCIIS